MVSAAPPSPAPAQPRFFCVPRPSLGDQHHEGDAPVLVQAVLGGREGNWGDSLLLLTTGELGVSMM